MAKRFVRAQPKADRLGELRDRLDNGEIESREPFGRAMTRALEKARIDPNTGEAVWIEEDYCSPPLAMERAEVLDDYFDEIAPMEVYSDEFSHQVRRALDADLQLVAAIHYHSTEGFIGEVKDCDDTEVFEVTETNRDELPTTIKERLQRSL